MRTGVDRITDAVSEIERQKNRYIKRALTALEEKGSVSQLQRKAILDLANDLTRSFYAMIGYSVEK